VLLRVPADLWRTLFFGLRKLYNRPGQGLTSHSRLFHEHTNTFKEPPASPMSDPNPSSPRPVLKLKTAPRKSPTEAQTPTPRPQSKANQKPGAAWSDELKHRMQEDMDALIRR
jgi:hypothetical protein